MLGYSLNTTSFN